MRFLAGNLDIISKFYKKNFTINLVRLSFSKFKEFWNNENLRFSLSRNFPIYSEIVIFFIVLSCMVKNSQHFMTDKKIISKICNYADLNKNDVVLEIGAGTGNLTFEIAKSTRVYAIEKDKKLIPKLQKIQKNNSNIHIIHGDALKYDFPKFNKVVANIPYAISRKLILKLLKYNFELGILTCQKEFAEKLTSDAGCSNYKFISAVCQSFWDMKIVVYVPASAFSPPPEVTSAIIEIKPLQGKQYDENYITFARELFNHRNKKLTGTEKRIYELTHGEILNLYNNSRK